MKRSQVLKLIANQLDFLKGTFDGYRKNFTEGELKKADVILTTLESSGIIKSFHKKTVIKKDIELMPYEDTIIVEGWENE